jgi:hypothetical protein
MLALRLERRSAASGAWHGQGRWWCVANVEGRLFEAMASVPCR